MEEQVHKLWLSRKYILVHFLGSFPARSCVGRGDVQSHIGARGAIMWLDVNVDPSRDQPGRGILVSRPLTVASGGLTRTWI
jgi:hypothetical protein